MTDITTENEATKVVPDSYAETKEQLDEIVAQVRKKDVSLEKSLDLLEEGVALANRATELIDQAAWEAIETEQSDDTAAEQSADEADVEVDAASDLDDIDADAVTEETT